MEALGTFGTMYLISGILGFGYMIFSIAMGQLHDVTDSAGYDTGFGGHDAAGGHDIGGHAAGGHDIGGHAAGGHDAGHHGAGGHDAGGHHGHGDGHSGQDATDEAGQLHQLTKVTGAHAYVRRQGPDWTMKVMAVFSPLSISVFLAFFGLTGFCLQRFIGPFAIVPALIAGLVMRKVTTALIRAFVVRSHVSTASKVEEAIGHEAEVCVSIQPGRTGEVTYVLGSKRYNMPAKCVKDESEYKRGSKVLITDIRNGVVMVEPWQELV